MLATDRSAAGDMAAARTMGTAWGPAGRALEFGQSFIILSMAEAAPWQRLLPMKNTVKILSLVRLSWPACNTDSIFNTQTVIHVTRLIIES